MRYAQMPSSRRIVSGVFLVSIPLLAFTLLTAQAVNPPGAPADHFLSYKTKTTKGTTKFAPIRNVHLADAFEDLSFDAVATGDLLAPVAAGGDTVVDAATHLRGYRIKAVKKSPKHVKRLRMSITNHLETLVMDTVKPDLLLVPTAEDNAISPPPPDPSTHNVDHFKCYLVHRSKGAAKLPKGLQVSVVDPFTQAARALDVRALKHLCLPVDKNSEGIKNALGELTCYTVKAAKGEPKHVSQLALQVNNQFGPLTLDTVQENELCVPSVLVVPSPTPTPNGNPATPTITTTPGPSVASGTPTVLPTGPIPPDPASVAPPVDEGVSSIPALTTSFLYTGANPIQTGIAPGTIELRRAAVIRGRVLDTTGSPLPGVTVSVWLHPELGQTLTRADGRFDLAVNGGGPLTLDYQKPGVCPVQRRLDVPWLDFVIAPDVVMIATDPVVTNVAFGNGSPFQAAESSMQTDGDGARHTLLLFAPGTTADLVMPNGTLQPANSLHIRATEFTVGPSGPAAMPAGLPPLSGYTYCVELSADEAVSAGAVSVAFNHPVITYAENFLGFAVGTPVPVGTYDRRMAAWVPLANGRVVKIIAIAGGLADVDTDGDNVADNGLGITTAERQRLAAVYTAGESLWRVPVSHFSSEDSNWSLSTPNDAVPPGQNGAGPDPNDPLQQPCESGGSIVECENQVLGESMSIVGTPYMLGYRSDRVPAQLAARTIRLSGPSVPASLDSISLHLSVAGRSFDQTFPASPNQQTTFVWDRMDVYGRQVEGGQTLDVTIDYNYPTTYTDPGPFPAAFNQTGGTSLAAIPSRQQIRLSDHFTTTIGEGLTDARTLGLGGWTLDVHHVYDPIARVLHGGNGSRRRAGSLGRAITTVDLVGKSVLFDVAVGPDGSQYVALPHGDLIIRVAPDGTQTVVAGNGTEGFSGDGGPATDAELGDPTGIAVAADGSLYIAEEANRRIRRVAPDGIITTVAGGGVGGDEIPATQAGLVTAERIAVGTDSSIYVVDGGRRVRRVTPDGIIHTAAGTGFVGFSGDGGPATAAQLNCAAVAPAPDGGFYIADFGNHRVRRVGPDGIINTVAEYTQELGLPQSVSLNRDGSLLIAVGFNGARTPQVDLLKTDGTLVTVAGGGSSVIQEGIPATQANLAEIKAVAGAPDGSIFIVRGGNSSLMLHVGAALPGFEGKQYLLASADGSQLYVFDLDGRHLQTKDATTGATLFEFGYDAKGLLSTVTEKTGGTDNVTTIEHDASGNPKGIVGPFGQRTVLTVDANGFLASLTNPAAEQTQFTSTPDGLLTTLTDPRGKTSTYSYDADARLLVDADPLGGSQTLGRLAAQSQFTVTRTTALAHTTTHEVESLPGNVQRRTVTEPDGSHRQSTEAIDAGTIHTASSDGTTSDSVVGPDPRFGLQAPLQTSMSLAFPSALTLTTTSTRSAVLANPADPLSLVSSTETNTVAGHTLSTTYTAATKTFVSTTPAGRTETLTLDALGRFVAGQYGGLDPVHVAYDGRGRISSMTIGSGADVRSVSYTYDVHGFVDTITDAAGRTSHLTHDLAGRVTSKGLPDGRVTTFSYDGAGNLTSVTPPGRPAHTLEYSDRNQLTLVTPPALPGTGSTTLAYDLDRAITNVDRAGFHSVAIDYDTFGRPKTRTLVSGGGPASIDTFGYDAAGRIATVAAASGVSVAYAYDGTLPTGETFSGPVAGSVTRTFDTSLRVASESVNGADPIAFSYDADGLLTGAGSLTIARDPQHGLMTGSALGVVSHSIGYNSSGEMTSDVVTASASPRYSGTFTRDALGRIAQKVETIGGATDTYTYTYELPGQLTEVAKNGVTIESYTYDDNGNRTAATVGGVDVGATYDAQDRVTQYGTTTFSYTPAGDLASKSTGAQTTSYEYDPLGNLRGVTLPNGTVITYLIDGRSRRVGKRVDDTLVQGFLYEDAARPIVELDGNGAVVSRFVYIGGVVPAYMIKGGIAFRFVSDQIGSVRLVVNSVTGAIVQRLDYDAFGNVVLDTSPGFQPFGFAGGLYDPATRLVRFGARDYDPATGHWTASDPTSFGGNDPNLYRYCHNDPVNMLDPTGLDVIDGVLGFSEQLTEEVNIAANPLLGIQLLVDSLVRVAASKLGFDPGESLADKMFHSSPGVDRTSPEYPLGVGIGQCAGIPIALASGGLEGAEEVSSAVARALDRSFEAADAVRRAEAKAAKQWALDQAKAADSRISVAPAENGAGNVSRGRNLLSGFGVQ